MTTSKQQMSGQLQEALSNFSLDLALIGQLIENNPSLLKTPNAYGFVPVQVAAKRSNSPLIKLIVELGGDVETRDQEGRTAVALACQGGSLYAVHTFNECGAKMDTVDNYKRTLMHHAAGIGAVHLMHYLHEVCDIPYDLKDAEGYTPLHMAAWNKSTEAVNYLLRKKCKASVTNMYGTTPLSIAAKNGSRGICRALILSTRENLLLIKDGNGLSPLDHVNKGTTIVHKELSIKLTSWTFAQIQNKFPYHDYLLFYFVMLAPGLSLTAAILMLVYFPYLFVSVPVALVIVLFGFFGTIINHRLPHDAQFQNPGASGAFLYGLTVTVVCYFSEVFHQIWPHNLISFFIIAVDFLLILYMFWKLQRVNPGFDKVGKTRADGTPMTILDVAKQSDGKQVQYSFCTHCEIVIPEYTKHCKLCESCCNGFDHHCLWLRTCIGKGNHRLFVLFLFTLVLDNFLFVKSALSALATQCGSLNPLQFVLYGAQHERFMLFLIACNFATGIFGLMNFGFQLSVISSMETTYFDSTGKIAYGKKRKPNVTSYAVRLITMKEFFFNYEKWFRLRLKSRHPYLI